MLQVRGGADRSLARPTSQCRRTGSIVPLERGVCPCAELQVFSCYSGWKEECQTTRARFQQHRDARCHHVFFFLQGKAPKEIHAILKEILGEHAPTYATFKNRVAQFKRGNLHLQLRAYQHPFVLACETAWHPPSRVFKPRILVR